MNSSETSLEPQSGLMETGEATSVPTEAASVPSEPDPSINEYYGLQKELFVTTLTMTGVVFVSVWIFYSLNLAINYAIGASVGVVYLRMLAKDVEALGRKKQTLSKTRMALFVGLIIVATQWNQLKLIPIFLGFLTYKASLIVYVLRTTFLPSSEETKERSRS